MVEARPTLVAHRSWLHSWRRAGDREYCSHHSGAQGPKIIPPEKPKAKGGSKKDAGKAKAKGKGGTSKAVSKRKAETPKEKAKPKASPRVFRSGSRRSSRRGSTPADETEPQAVLQPNEEPTTSPDNALEIQLDDVVDNHKVPSSAVDQSRLRAALARIYRCFRTAGSPCRIATAATLERHPAPVLPTVYDFHAQLTHYGVRYLGAQGCVGPSLPEQVIADLPALQPRRPLVALCQTVQDAHEFVSQLKKSRVCPGGKACLTAG